VCSIPVQDPTTSHQESTSLYHALGGLLQANVAAFLDCLQARTADSPAAAVQGPLTAGGANAYATTAAFRNVQPFISHQAYTPSQVQAASDTPFPQPSSTAPAQLPTGLGVPSSASAAAAFGLIAADKALQAAMIAPDTSTEYDVAHSCEPEVRLACYCCHEPVYTWA
jgi:hypothetical protein